MLYSAQRKLVFSRCYQETDGCEAWGTWPLSAGHSAPGLVVVLLDLPVYQSSSEPRNFSQPQLLTDAVSSPVAAVVTGHNTGNPEVHLLT